MKKWLFEAVSLILLSFITSSASAQLNKLEKNNIGISVGAINYSGFMKKEAITFDQARLAAELMYRYDVTRQFHVRATAMIGSLGVDNGPDYRPNGVNRSGSFKTGIFDIDILPEYDFIDLTAHHFTPYIFAGGGYYGLFSYEKNGVKYNKSDNNGFNFRGGLGVKYAVTPAIQLSLEGSRREFSKSIDPYNSKNSPSRYYNLMVGVSYRLGAFKDKELW